MGWSYLATLVDVVVYDILFGIAVFLMLIFFCLPLISGTNPSRPHRRPRTREIRPRIIRGHHPDRVPFTIEAAACSRIPKCSTRPYGLPDRASVCFDARRSDGDPSPGGANGHPTHKNVRYSKRTGVLVATSTPVV